MLLYLFYTGVAGVYFLQNNRFFCLRILKPLHPFVSYFRSYFSNALTGRYGYRDMHTAEKDERS